MKVRLEYRRTLTGWHWHVMRLSDDAVQASGFDSSEAASVWAAGQGYVIVSD